jgi:Ser/Thr protein kinase RdoA (MazF antagonist)
MSRGGNLLDSSEDPGRRSDEIEAALKVYSLNLVGPPEPVAKSVRNQNYRVATDQGLHFVRFHRPTRALKRLRREHRVITWAAGQGIPVAVPLRSMLGDTLNEVHGRFVAVFPWIDGRSLNRGSITAAQAAAMGAMHGRLHNLLADYGDDDLPWFWDLWEPNTVDSSRKLTQYLGQLPDVDLPADQREIVRACLETQIEHLTQADPLRPPALNSIGVQPVHGDYHERNVLLDDSDNIVGVVDWEMVTRMPRAFELVRCLTYASLLARSLIEAYLLGYRDHSSISSSECSDAVELWWQYNLRDTWLARTRLNEGDVAVQPFFAEHLEFMAQFGDPTFRAHLRDELCRLAEA